MKVINTGAAEIRLITQGKQISLSKDDIADIDERTFMVLHKIFPALVAAEEQKVVIESKPQPIETKKKVNKNGRSKKSK